MSIVAIKEILKGKHIDEKITIRGWIYRKRDGKKNVFLIVRDSTDIIQCIVTKNSVAWEDANKVTIESSIKIEGKVKKDVRAPKGYEITVDKLEIFGLAEVFPITQDKSEEFLRDVRHLWLRSRKMNLIMKIRSKVILFINDFFQKEGFFQVSPPTLITSACEGGSTLFKLKYFNRDLYLTQSAQLYLEILIYSLEKVYCLAPSFRAEKSRTIRHLSEYWHIEAEQAFAKMEDLMSFEEELLTYICKKTSKECEDELKELNVDITKLTSISTPFPRITYTEAIDRLKDKGFKIKWGDDLGFEEEKQLAEDFKKPFFMYDYPTKIKAFYCKTYVDHPEIAMSTDLLVPRIGEISTGGAREDNKEKLQKRIKEQNLREEDYEWYIDLRRYGTVPHAGFGMGLERLLTWMLDLENIIDTLPFPRTTRRFYP